MDCHCLLRDIPHSLHFSVSGHFGGFYVLAVVNSASLKIGVHMSFLMISFSKSKPGSGLQDHVIPVCLVFKETPCCFL